MAMRVLRAVFVMAFLVLLSAAAPKNDTNTDTAKKTPTPTAIHTSTPTPTPAPTTPTTTPTPTLTIPPTSPPTTPPPLPSLPVNVMVASDAAAYDNLGSSVAISDELIASGAPNHNTSGAVYVFTCVPTYDSEPHCSQLSEISPTDSTGGDLFGNSLAFLGANLVVIGAPNWSNNEGKVYIYNCASSPCTLATSLYNPNTTEDANFGSTVSVSGERVVIGAPDTNSETASGTAVIFTCTGSTPTCTQGYTIAPSGSPISAQFGLGAISQIESVASVTGPVIAIGALNYSSTGAVFLFNCNSDSSSCTQQTVLLASNANSGDQFGFSIAMTSSGSAPLTVIVGAIESDNGAGAIYVFACNLPTCTQINNFQPSDVNQGDQFGYSLAIVESSLFVGSQNALGVGVVYAFDVSNFTNIVSVFTLSASDQTYSAAYGSPQFGNAIALDTTSQILVVTAPNGTPQGNAAVEAAGEIDAFSYIPVPVPSGPGVTPTQPHGAATDLSLAASITIFCAFVTLLAPVVLGHS